MKKLIQVDSSWISSYSSYTPDDLISMGNYLKERGINHVGIEGYTENFGLETWEERLETDKEYNKRIKQEEKDSAKREKFDEVSRQREIKELARLKKKYEN